jgi:PPM family protein phosphatase
MPSSGRAPDTDRPPGSAAHPVLPLIPVLDPSPPNPPFPDPTEALRVKTRPAPAPDRRRWQEEGEASAAPAALPDDFEHRPVFPTPVVARNVVPDEEDRAETPVAAALPSVELPSLLFDDDDDEEEVTVVGNMSEEMKALRRGYRKKALGDSDDDRPHIEIHSVQELDALLVEELLEDGPVDPTPKIALVGHGATDRGHVRAVNQDAIALIPHHHTFVIADGMGGPSAGEVASALATESIEEAIETRHFTGEPNLLWPALGDELARAIEMANGAIHLQAVGPRQGMGTTVTAARFSPKRQRAYIAHVGDSRAYRIRGDQLVQLTQDHTMGNLVGASGAQGAQLSRAVGVESDVEVDLVVDIPRVGDRYLLCTDGLTKMVSDPAILALVLTQKNLARCGEALIDAAKHAGGKDNIGIVLVQIYPPASS